MSTRGGWQSWASLVLLLGFLGGCQRVGSVPSPGTSPTPVQIRGVAVSVLDSLSSRVVLDPIQPVQVAPEVDRILHAQEGLDAAIEARIEFWIQRWTGGGAGSFQRDLERMARFSPWIDEEIEALGLPRSLRALPMIESSYNPLARSRSGAVGLWQIMPGTATGLGLEVSAILDERRDPIRSTKSALGYLAHLHEQFDSWFLALAAYNAGQGRVRAIVQGAPEGETGDRTYARLRARFPAETRDFVPRFLAAARLIQNPEKYGLRWPDEIEPWAFDDIIVPDATALDVVAQAAGVDPMVIRDLNPHVIRGYTPPGRATHLRIPIGTRDTFEVAYAQIPPQDRVPFVEHRIVAGETLSRIASRYGITLSELQRTNPGLDPRRLQIGQILTIPTSGSGTAQTAGARTGVADR